MGRLFGGPLLALAKALERPLQRQVGRIFKRVDVVLAPTTAKPPERIGAIDGLGHWDTDKVVVGACPYAWPWNVLGWPGVNVPAGLTPEGLPLGASLLGAGEQRVAPDLAGGAAGGGRGLAASPSAAVRRLSWGWEGSSARAGWERSVWARGLRAPRRRAAPWSTREGRIIGSDEQQRRAAPWSTRERRIIGSDEQQRKASLLPPSRVPGARPAGVHAGPPGYPGAPGGDRARAWSGSGGWGGSAARPLRRARESSNWCTARATCGASASCAKRGAGRSTRTRASGEGSYRAALHAAGGACAMVRALLGGEAAVGFCGVRPSGPPRRTRPRDGLLPVRQRGGRGGARDRGSWARSGY